MLSLTQPYASGIPLGWKTWETRSWPTKYRGPLGIHAAKAMPMWAKGFAKTEMALGRLPNSLPLGAVVAVVDLADCQPTEYLIDDITGLERLYGNYLDGRFAWKLENIRPLAKPIPWRGSLGLWTPPEPLYRRIMEQLTDA